MTRPENQRTFLGALGSAVISAPFSAFAQPAECELQLIAQERAAARSTARRHRCCVGSLLLPFAGRLVSRVS